MNLVEDSRNLEVEPSSRAWLRALETTARATRDPSRVLPVLVQQWAENRGETVALVSDVETFSYRALAERVNRYSRWALAIGVAKGEAVALAMGNRPDYFAIWLGLTQIGAIVALMGPDWPAPVLAHALKVSGSRRLVVDARCANAVARLEPGVEIWTHGFDQSGARRIDTVLADLSGAALTTGERREVTLSDRALRIFTSGTTGLPKAAEVSHHRIISWTHWFAGLANLTGADRFYNCLPMHHSVGGVVAIGAPLVNGGSVAIVERFSARRFWGDVTRWDCTAFQYIGELCRYLVAAPASAIEKEHKLRLALGNGLSPEIWRRFLDRFGPLRVLEFYASTEGNVWLYNVDGRIGAIGRVPSYLASREPIALAKFDPETRASARGADGFCARCGNDEIGEALGRIDADAAKFEGYSDPAETDKKVLRDVFTRGDAWMRTGDLMRRDADGFYVFVDRIGDTFRWKGENIATHEVENALAGCPGVADVIVYGVVVPGADGRAGMATLRVDGKLDLAEIACRLETLPRAARPLFLRIAREIETTDTFKPKRAAYAEAGFDPARSEDPLYLWDSEAGVYVPLDPRRYLEVVNSGTRF